MKVYQYITIIMIVIVAVTLVPGGVVQAFPPLPSSFHGRIRLNGANLPAGTTIQALISDQVYATSTIELYQGDSVYSLIVPGDDPGTAVVEGAQQGSVISFQVNGQLADQTATWQSGTSVALDLTITTNTTPNTATPTSAPQKTQTGTVPALTVTAKISQEPVETNQPAATNTPLPVETQQISKEDTHASATEDLLSESFEKSKLIQTQVGAGEKLTDNSKSSSGDRDDFFSRLTQGKSGIWTVIGFAVIGLGCIGLGAWYLRKRSKPDQDLL